MLSFERYTSFLFDIGMRDIGSLSAHCESSVLQTTCH